MTTTTPLERDARQLWTAMLQAGLANDVREWDERSGSNEGWRWHTPALDDATKAKVLNVAAAIRTLSEQPVKTRQDQGDGEEA